MTVIFIHDAKFSKVKQHNDLGFYDGIRFADDRINNDLYKELDEPKPVAYKCGHCGFPCDCNGEKIDIEYDDVCNYLKKQNGCVSR